MARLNDLQILITADQAYRAFEAAFADARDRVDMGFRVFDPTTKLLSETGRAFGDTWVDLIVAKLDEGVRISLRLTDFDPIVRPWMHRDNWKSLSVFAGITELTCNPGLLDVRISDHPARTGWGPRLVLWPKVQAEISKTSEALSGCDTPARREALRHMPGFGSLLTEEDGKIVPVRQRVPAMMPATHHQKVAVIDDCKLYIGGLDVDHRRLDTPEHRLPADQTWHDVQLLVAEPQLALSARQHLERFEAETRGERPVQAPPGLLRTLSQQRQTEALSLSPEIAETGILDRHLELIGQAQDFIYLESQFLRDATLVDALVARAAEAPRLGLVCLLPAAPMEVAFEKESGLDMKYGEYLQAQCLDRLTDAFGARCMIVTPARPCATDRTGRAAFLGAPIVFVHSKVSIFDNRAGIVSSANLNGRSMRWDTELALELDAPDQVEALRNRVMGVWLPEGAGPEMVAAEPDTVARWRRLAEQNAAAQPEDRAGFILPYDISVARDFGAAMPGIPAEMV